MSLKLNIENFENKEDKTPSKTEIIKVLNSNLNIKDDEESKNEESKNEESEDEESKNEESEDEESEDEESEDEESEDEESEDEESKNNASKNEDESEDEESESDESDDEDFKKLEQDIKKDNLIYFHTNSKHISQEELSTLCKIVRNKNGLIIDPLHKTLPYLTKFEKARVIGLRAKQINNGADPFIDVPNNMIEGLTIAEKELEEKKIPFIIRRPLPNGASEYWKINDLEFL